MKRALSLLLILFITTSMFAQNSYTQEWTQIDSLLQLRQPQSAQKFIDQIYQQAMAQNNVAQLVKAHLYRSYSQNLWNEEGLIKSIIDTEEAISKTEPPSKNILHSIAAELYWRYYSENRWRFHNRTATEIPTDDIRTWDLQRLIEKCLTYYNASLLDADELKNTAIESLSDMLTLQVDSRIYRPTLYDFLAFRAIEFFNNNETSLLQPAEPFLVNDPYLFAPVSQFATLEITTTDSLSFKFGALALFQQVISFHLNDPDPSALIDADLLRLDFVYKNTTVPQKEFLYIEALQNLERCYTDHPSSSEIQFRIAQNFSSQGKKRQAIEVIERAIQRFPNSLGAHNSLALLSEIKQPEIEINADEATLPNMPSLLSISYKNISLLHYKIVPIDFLEALDWRENSSNMIRFYDYHTPLHTGLWTLPNSDDYQPHTIEMALPALPKGYYVIIASTTPDFSNDSFVLEKPIWVSNLSYVRQEFLGNNTILVLHRETGKPVANVEVREYYSEYNTTRREYVIKYGNTLHSDAQGLVPLHLHSNYRFTYLYLSHGEDQYASGENFYLYRNNYQEQTSITTTFFTDRAIYRPGQTIWFKGLVLEWKDKEAKIVEKRKQTVALYNTNSEKVSEMEVVTNEFGSFSGSFTLPSGGLTGQMYLTGESGRISFRVEEYKRPKFEVMFEPANDSYRLGDEMTVTGKAMNYAGNPVSEANVSFRVVRQALYPLWRWWWGPVPYSAPQEITTGQTVTEVDGSFGISFTAIPDPQIDRKSAPLFHYTIYATVSDINGETHEINMVIPVSYQSLMVSTDIPERMNVDEKSDFQIIATNLNGVAQAAQGSVNIWRLYDPGRVLQERRWKRPDQYSMTKETFIQLFPYGVYDNEDHVEEWKKGELVCQLMFDTQTETTYTLPDVQKWGSGKYIVEIKTEDAFGEAVENSAIFTLFSATYERVPAHEPIWFHVLNPVTQPGETVKVLMGSAYSNVEAFYEVIGKEGRPQRKSIVLNCEQKLIELPVTENDRGNFSLQLFFVKNNRSYSAGEVIQVPFENKRLNLEFASFRDKLQPGTEEEWSITLKDTTGDVITAELLASMYDASLDAFAQHVWNFFPWRNNSVGLSWRTDQAFLYQPSNQLSGRYSLTPYLSRFYDQLTKLDALEPTILNQMAFADVSIVASAETRSRAVDIFGTKPVIQFQLSEEPQAAPTIAAPTPAPLQIRTNFNETAFFYPHLRTNEKGETVITFTIPEALTRWKMQGLAWTKDLKVGSVTKELVTQKELMIFTNPPRFFRENDTLWFSAKLSNISDKILDIKTEIQLFDALTMRPVTQELLLENSVKQIQVEAGGNHALSWNLHIPEGLQAITYRITALSDSFSDGEESTLPVMPNRMLVTESLPLPIRAHQTKSFEFTKLLNNQSNTLKNYAYTLEFTSNPAWSAIQALPYIMEYPYECSEQAFSRYYANSIATFIVHSDPKIKQIFDIWRNWQPNALQSNLEKNEELKALLLEETPWVRAAQNESERKQRIAILFDLNRMNNEMASALHKVEQAQTSNGGFAWFKGGPDSRYITQHIVAGVGHLLKMGIPTKASENMLRKAIAYMDARITEDLNEIKKEAAIRQADYTKEDHLSYLAIHYLYTRSFFKDLYPIPPNVKEAFDFYTLQATTYWTSLNNYLKGMLALSLHRFNNTQTSLLIMKSLSETALTNDEMGMYWRSEPGWWWYQAPIETQALMIEAYHEVLNDQKSVEELKVWLLKQKSTTDWKTTKASSEAIYALLLTGSNLLVSDALCQITVGGQTIDPYKLEEGNRPEAGTGTFKTSWHGQEVKPDMGKITVSNPNPTVAWGSAYWQYFEQLDKITQAETGVSIQKSLFVKSNTPSGPILKEITDHSSVKVGDKITVRIEIRADRDMEYVHLKDNRAAAFEPVNVLSGYRWQDGLGYYESTRDASTNFFISYLPKGTYVFEYDLFATQQGDFSNGITTLQCMYAPEFTSHSQGIRVRVVSE